MNERDEDAGRPIGFLWIYTGIAALVGVTALDFEIQPHLYQLLPEQALRQSLWESMLYYHAQPPLLNLMLGLAYALEGATGIAAGTSLLVVHLLLGAGAVHALWRLAEALVPGRRTRRVVQALVLLHPVLYSSLFLYFYTLHELFFLSRLAYHAHRYFARRRAPDLAFACAMAIGLTLSRSLFHPLWALAVLALLLGPKALRTASGGTPLRQAAVVGAAAGLAFAWPCKNLAVFGFFGSCSWQGFHLARGLPVAHPPERPMFFQPSPKAERAHALATSWIPDPFHGIAALSARKDGGWPNWNHYQMLAYSGDLEAATLDYLAEHPERSLQMVGDNYERYAVFTGRDPYTGKLDGRVLGTWIEVWMRAYESATCLYFDDDTFWRPGSGLHYLLPALLALIAWSLFRRRRERTPQWRTALLMAFCVAWAMALILCVDGAEGNRMRFSTEPLLLLCVAWCLGRTADATVGFPPRRESPAEPGPLDAP